MCREKKRRDGRESLYRKQVADDPDDDLKGLLFVGCRHNLGSDPCFRAVDPSPSLLLSMKSEKEKEGQGVTLPVRARAP